MPAASEKRKPKKHKGKAKPAGSWAARLQALRHKLDLTQAQAAERADIAVRTWIAWENGQRFPGRIARKLLAQAFPDLIIK